MKATRFVTVLVVVATLGITSAVFIKQQTRIRGLKENRRSLGAQYQELSATNASLLFAEAAQNYELVRLRQQTSEVLRLRNQLNLARQQLATTSAANHSPKAENLNERYMTKDQWKFAGFDTPENAFQSLYWAGASGDYSNWLEALAPGAQESEKRDPSSLQRFRDDMARITGMEVLTAKPVGTDRVELKVRVDTENAALLFVYPMVAIGGQWRLGDDIHPYTHEWDTTGSAQ